MYGKSLWRAKIHLLIVEDEEAHAELIRRLNPATIPDHLGKQPG
jgi:hypothetical protein